MRILIVHNTLNDSRSVSGVLRHFGWMASAWNAAGHQTDFVAAKAGWPQIKELAPGSRLYSSDNLFDATRHLDQTWRYFPAYAWRLLTCHWMRLPERYDVVYASTQLIVEVYAARVLARRQRARLVAKVHHVLGAQAGRRSFFDRLFLWSERKTTRWLNKEADLVICGTELVAKDFHDLERKLGLTPRPTIQVGYGVDLEAGGLQPEEKLYDAVALGRLHEHKGALDIARYWKAVTKRMPQARLLVIGEGPHRSRAEQMARDEGISDRVRFTGGVDEKEKNQLVRRSRIGVSLSYEEGWGLSINEFLASRLPVVAYELPVFQHVFPEQLVLVPTGDWEQAAVETVHLLNDAGRQRHLGDKGREFVGRHDYREVAKRELEAIRGSEEKGMREDRENA